MNNNNIILFDIFPGKIIQQFRTRPPHVHVIGGFTDDIGLMGIQKHMSTITQYGSSTSEIQIQIDTATLELAKIQRVWKISISFPTNHRLFKFKCSPYFYVVVEQLLCSQK